MDLKLKRNVFLKAVEAVVTIAASFIQLSFIARSYAPAMVGQYQLTLAWLFFVSALSCFGGVVMVSTLELTRSGESDRPSIFSTALALQAIIALPLCVFLLLIFHLSNYFNELSLSLSIGTIALLGAMILQLSQSLLISKELIGKVVIASIAAHLLTTAAIIIASYLGAPPSVLVGVWALYNVIHGAILFLQSRAWRMISLKLVKITLIKKLAVEIIPVLVMVLATHLYVRIDVIMLDHYTSKEVVAQYSAGYLFLDQLMILSNFMMSGLFPNFARSCLERGTTYRMLYRGILKLFLKYLVPIAFLVAIFSKFLLSALYGPEYTTAWRSLSVLMLAALFAWLNGPSGTIFISLKKQHIYMWVTLVSLAVNVAGNVILIPSLGAVGAAISTVMTEAAMCGFCLWWIYRETGFLPWMMTKK